MNKLSVCLTFDVDAMSAWINTMKTKNPSALSRGEFTVLGTQRVLAFLKRKAIRATFFIPGHTALAFPDLVKMIRDEGHEIGHHGWVHENPAERDKAGQQEVLEKGFDALHRAAGVRPVGYRSPAWDLAPDSLPLLRQNGIIYDSSLMGSDFLAYYPRIADTFGPDAPYQFGETIDMVELPAHWSLDDFVAFETVLGLLQGFVPPREIEQMWRDDFDFAADECGGGIFTLTLHPQCIGRGSRLRMLERLVDHMRATEGVVFETMETYARRWAAEHPLEAWKAANPLRTGVNSLH
jgi:peptidoglycan/xylan/chitin deacetylase (PgdA/CDA1 family)